MDEKELVRRSKEGDGEAFGSLVKAYQTKVFNMAYSLTRNKDIADDLAQEVFIKAYVALSKFKEKSRFGTWLYRIAVNHVKDYLRKKAPLKQVSLEETWSDPAAQGDKMLDEERQREQKHKNRIIHKALSTLPEKYQIIISLRDMQGFAYVDISRMLNISLGTVDSRLHRARKMLRNKAHLLMNKEGGTS
jgi:RNA polymerase sigma-70 factor (ECF subfamily)